MRSWKHALLTVAFVLGALIPAGQAIAAEEVDATPESIPLLTSPAYCSAERANPNRLAEIAGSAVDDPDAVIPDELIPLTGATIVTEDEADAVASLAQEFVACINANDELRAVSLLTDDFIKRSAFDLLGDSELEENPEPLDADDQARIAAETDVYQLSDGRYAYTFDLGPVTGESPFARLQLIVIELDGEFKIDDLRFEDIEDPQPDCISEESDGCALPDGPDCGSEGTDSCLPPEEASPISGEGYTGWIMTAEQSSASAIYFVGNTHPYNGYQVSAEQIAEAEAALPAYLEDQERATPRLIVQMQAGLYERQYLGYSFEFQFLLVINAYCEVPGDYDPAEYAVVVDDGGDCFWQATYDITQERFISFSVNGEA